MNAAHVALIDRIFSDLHDILATETLPSTSNEEQQTPWNWSNILDPQQDEPRMNGAEGATLRAITEGIKDTMIETTAD